MGIDIGILLLRLFMGGFFLLAFYMKTFDPVVSKHAWPALRKQLGLAPYWQWLIPAAQLAGGLGLVFGVLTSFAAAGLLAILIGAFIMDVYTPFCKTNPPKSHPFFWYNLCENYHILMILILLVLVFTGSGALGFDALIGGLL